MGVFDGQPVSAAITNPAFLDANTDDTAFGKIDFANPDSPSGATVFNIQRELNAINSFLGKLINQAKDNLPTWTNNDIGTSTDDIKDRLEALSSIPLQGYIIQGTALTGVTGTSKDVTSVMGALARSSGSTVKGVVVTPPYNRVIMLDSSGDPFVDGSGNRVYGRITYSASVWTLSFFSLISSVETAYSFASSDMSWYFQQLFSPMSAPPIYADFSAVPYTGGGSGGKTIINQEIPTGAVDGSNNLFAISKVVTDSSLVVWLVDGSIVEPSKWDLIQSGGISYIRPKAGYIPATSQDVATIYFTKVSLTSVILTGGGLTVHGTQGAPVAVNPAAGIIPSADPRQLIYLVSTGGAQTVTANPQIAAGTVVGQELQLRGTSDANYSTISDGAGLSLNGPFNFKNRAAINLEWDGTIWSENSRR